ncbi:MAG: stalk domain-containing protein [Armatimonas sp.]
MVLRRNDSGISGVGGSLSLIKGEHTSVRMVRETITMVLESSDYVVTVDFVFRNEGPAATVLMGFPESGAGDVSANPKNSAMKSFASWVDGALAKTKWVPVKSSPDEGEYKAHWVKEVRFGAGQTRKIRVRYRSDYGGAASPGLRNFVRYEFTGANWKGKVDESVLNITFRRPGNFVTTGRIYPAGGEEGAVAFTQTGATLSRTWKNWEAQAGFIMAFGTAPATWRATITTGNTENVEDRVPGAVMPPPDKTRTITVSGSVKKDYYDWCPPIFTATGGIPMIALKNLGWLAETKLTPEEPKEKATIAFGTHSATVTLGQKAATIDGKAVMLAAAPRLLRQSVGEFDVMYVPLLPFAEALGLKVELVPGEHVARVVR